jgi:acylpyruvate hydrolase
MRVVAFKQKGQRRLGVEVEDGLIDMSVAAPDLPNDLGEIIKANKLGKLQAAAKKAKKKAHVKMPSKLLPPIEAPGKIICVGLNYIDHAAEGGFEKPGYPVLFLRVNTTLIGQGDAMIRPRCSEQYDYEGEMVAVIGKKAKHVAKSRALDYIVGYSVFNDGSVRDYQFKSPQWTSGKNFDASGAFGPAFVTADELPKGGRGLALTTRLNGEVVQEANTRDLIFPVDELVAVASEVMTLEPGDIIVTGTPSGVGAFRKPPLWMKDGDVCEVEVEKIGVLRNPIKDEKAPKRAAPKKAAAKKK